MSYKLEIYMRKYLWTILSFLMMSGLSAQKIEKVFLDKNDTTRNYYTIIYPDSLPWEGYPFTVFTRLGIKSERRWYWFILW